jgi:pyruvate/2-oxoglutarate dehydrogenase complex dihydrolipoamide acyltransferase (E2) component
MTAIGVGIDPSGYQLSYPVFIASLQPSLLHHYSPPGAARAAAPAAVAPAPAAAAPAPAANIQAKLRIRALNGGTPGTFPPQPQPAGWTLAEVNRIINAADVSVSDDIKNSVPFIQANYDDAVLAYINNRANQGAKPPTVFRI